MMRGAQSGGIVTFTKDHNGLRGLRSRCVNKKRTNLSVLLLRKLAAQERWARFMGTLLGRRLINVKDDHSRLYCGHTRFATTSKASLEGTHPHQWTKPEYHDIYRGNWKEVGGIQRKPRLVEIFVTHNGDFDAWTVGGVSRNLKDIQTFLVRATWSPLPSSVDSCAIAGVMDILNAQGSWFHAIRRAFFINGGLHGTVKNLQDMPFPSRAELVEVCSLINSAFDAEVKGYRDLDDSSSSIDSKEVYLYRDLASPGAKDKCVSKSMDTLRNVLPERFAGILKEHAQRWMGEDREITDAQATVFSQATVENFYDCDMMHSTRYFLAHATGSFGISVSSALESHRRVCLAARGQTMSVAFYPRFGIACWASEAAATKSPLLLVSGNDVDMDLSNVEYGNVPMLDAVGFDLDNLQGEICLLDWGCNIPERGYDRSDTGVLPTLHFLSGKLSVTLVKESSLQKMDFMTLRESLKDRLYDLEHTPNPLPALKSSTLSDIRDIPSVCARLQHEWCDPGTVNRVTAESLGEDVQYRLKMDKRGSRSEASRSIDVILTGCEVSLWVAEQFASDLSQVFPRLRVKCASANKILGLFGQSFPLHSTGFDICEEKWDLTDSIVIVVSHSGGTFAPLALCSLLSGVTSRIYTVTSGVDTEIAKLLAKNHIFSTGIGLRPGEACTVSVVATHQVLTQILLQLISQIGAMRREESVASLHDCSQMQRMNEMSITALESITGCRTNGDLIKNTANSKLKATGSAWANHCIEAPLIWLFCFFYIMATVGFGLPSPIYLINDIIEGILGTAGQQPWDESSPPLGVTLADALLYIFIPQIATIALRIVQRRPLLHRMTGRSVLICDTPMVCQCVEAMASKMFACTYSNTNVAFYSGNPSDHLVHRFTHRTARGLLIACGRPDGRLQSLASAEAATCLSVTQACSIINLGEGAEAVTIGHNPAPLPLSKKDIVLQTSARPEFLCEVAMKEVYASGEAPSANELLGRYSNVWNHSKQALAATLMASFGKRTSSLGNDPNWASTTMTAIKNGIFSWTNESSFIVEPSRERYFGQAVLDSIGETAAGNAAASDSKLVDKIYQVPQEDSVIALCDVMASQDFVMRMYESRFACIERLVAFFVLFHAMAKKVRDFWNFVSFGILTYEIERTQSSMRVATTASPVSGAMVRDRMSHLTWKSQWKEAREKMQGFVHAWRDRRRHHSESEF